MTERVRADGIARAQTEDGKTNAGAGRSGEEFVAFTLGAGTVNIRPFQSEAGLTAAVLENLKRWRSYVVAVFEGPVRVIPPGAEDNGTSGGGPATYPALTALGFDLAGDRAVFQHHNRTTRTAAEVSLMGDYCTGQLMPITVLQGWYRPVLMWQHLMDAAIGADNRDQVAERLEAQLEVRQKMAG